MNISKFTIVWKFLTGGREGVLDYALDCANSFAAKIPDAKQEELKGYLETAQKVLDTLSGLSWLCPKKWALAYGHTVAAFADLVSALQDLKLTADEIATVTAAFQTAYASWRAE